MTCSAWCRPGIPICAVCRCTNFGPANYHPLLKDAALRQDFCDEGEAYPFRRVEGEGLYEITVGPVHAGIIEPGHFRFSVEGETIINLESRMYFVHKGIEKLFESATLVQGVKLAERISGDSSVAHALAFCQAVEALSGVTIPPRAAYLASSCSNSNDSTIISRMSGPFARIRVLPLPTCTRCACAKTSAPKRTFSRTPSLT